MRSPILRIRDASSRLQWVSSSTSSNAVQTQIWIAVRVYLLMAITEKELRIWRSLSEIQQILDAAIFQKEPILQALSQRPIPNLEDTVRKGPSLFDI